MFLIFVNVTRCSDDVYIALYNVVIKYYSINHQMLLKTNWLFLKVHLSKNIFLHAACGAQNVMPKKASQSPPFFVNSASQYAWFTLDTIFRVDIAEGIWKAVSVYIWCKDVEEGGSYWLPLQVLVFCFQGLWCCM